MTYFLWFMAVIGAWNLINMIGRIYCHVDWKPYSYHVFIGIWAAYFLITG